MGLKKNVWAGKALEDEAAEKAATPARPMPGIPAPAPEPERGYFHRPNEKRENIYLMRDVLAHLRKNVRTGQRLAVLIEQIEVAMRPFDLEPCFNSLPQSAGSIRRSIAFLIKRMGWLRDFENRQNESFRIYTMLREVDRAFDASERRREVP